MWLCVPLTLCAFWSLWFLRCNWFCCSLSWPADRQLPGRWYRKWLQWLSLAAICDRNRQGPRMFRYTSSSWLPKVFPSLIPSLPQSLPRVGAAGQPQVTILRFQSMLQLRRDRSLDHTEGLALAFLHLPHEWNNKGLWLMTLIVQIHWSLGSTWPTQADDDALLRAPTLTLDFWKEGLCSSRDAWKPLTNGKMKWATFDLHDGAQSTST